MSRSDAGVVATLLSGDKWLEICGDASNSDTAR
jgi:hypothetical protein